MKKWFVRIMAVVLVIGLLAAIQRLVMPKYMDDILEGSFIEEYYDETTDHDVIFVGDCEVYANYSPVVLWEDYGITSYIRGSAQQLMWQSYYLLEETMKRESPKVVILNVQAMKYNAPVQESYNRMTLDGMRWSSSKYHAIKASMTEEEQMLDYVFPLLRFHSRLTALTDSDFMYYLSKRKVTHNGYYMRVDTMPADDVEWTEAEVSDYTFGDYAWDYLEKIRTLCEENGAALLLVKAPSISPVWYDEYEQQIEAYAGEHALTYINFLEHVSELGLDYREDTYDAGLHLNLSGATKLSKYLGQVLSSRFALSDHRKEPEYEAVWAEKCDFYYEMKAAQERELKEYGVLKSFGGYVEEEENPMDEDGFPEDE